MNTIIEMKNVYFQAQTHEIVNDFSFQFEMGKTTALVGHSGSGKSTVLKLAAGLLVPTGGEVFYKDKRLSRMNKQENLVFRKETAMVFQDSALWANQSIYQILELPLRLHYPQMDKKERDERMKVILSQVGYKRQLDLRPAQLSVGEQKLIAFARAMLCEPELLFLDEWTESLDESAAQRLIALVRERQKSCDTIIFVSHDFKTIKSLADYIVMVVEGRFSRIFTGEQIDSDADLVEYIEEGVLS